MKYGKNGAGRVAALELDSEWMRAQILPRAGFVCVQGIIEYQLEVRRRRCSGRVSVRHEVRSRSLFELVGEIVGVIVGVSWVTGRWFLSNVER